MSYGWISCTLGPQVSLINAKRTLASHPAQSPAIFGCPDAEGEHQNRSNPIVLKRLNVSLGSRAVLTTTSASRPLYPRQPTTCCNAQVVDAVNLKDRLRDIETNRRDRLHDLAPPNQWCPNSAHIDGTLVPREEPSTAS